MRRALLLTAAWALLLPLGAAAQAQQTASGCSVPEHLPPAQLSGLWELTLWPESPRETQVVSEGALLLEPHPDYAGSVRGDLKRSSAGNDLQAVVSGDVTEGSFHLDESEDGERMSAVWDGTAQDCAGRIRITGLRRPAEGGAGGPVLRFRIQRKPSW
jgi:hypothetical protein